MQINCFFGLEDLLPLPPVPLDVPGVDSSVEVVADWPVVSGEVSGRRLGAFSGVVEPVEGGGGIQHLNVPSLFVADELSAGLRSSGSGSGSESEEADDCPEESEDPEDDEECTADSASRVKSNFLLFTLDFFLGRDFRFPGELVVTSGVETGDRTELRATGAGNVLGAANGW